MSAPSVTRASLLVRIRDPRDRIAWTEFVRLYAPLLHGYALKNGLQDADAADLAQDVLMQVVRSAAGFEYDRSRGTFRGWLLTVARNAIRKAGVRRHKQAAGTGDSHVQGLLAEQPERGGDDAEWDREYRWNLFQWAARRVQVEFREATWNAFWRTVVEGKSIDVVAAELGVSSGAIYVARSRAMARIRQEIVAAEGEDFS